MEPQNKTVTRASNEWSAIPPVHPTIHRRRWYQTGLGLSQRSIHRIRTGFLRALGPSRVSFGMQMLYGMADELKAASVDEGL